MGSQEAGCVVPRDFPIRKNKEVLFGDKHGVGRTQYKRTATATEVIDGICVLGALR